MIVNRINKRLSEEDLAEKYIKLLEDTLDRIENDLAKMFQKANEDGSWSKSKIRKYNRKKKLQQQIRQHIKDWKNGFKDELLTDLSDQYLDQFGNTKEYLVNKGATNANLAHLPKRQLNKFIFDEVDIKGKTFKEYLSKFSTDFAFDLEQEIFEGIAMGVNPRETSRRLYQVGNISKNRAETTVRSWYNAILNQADHDVMKKAKGVKAKLYNATLDSRTTAICMARDNKVYTIDNAPPLPAHFN